LHDGWIRRFTDLKYTATVSLLETLEQAQGARHRWTDFIMARHAVANSSASTVQLYSLSSDRLQLQMLAVGLIKPVIDHCNLGTDIHGSTQPNLSFSTAAAASVPSEQLEDSSPWIWLIYETIFECPGISRCMLASQYSFVLDDEMERTLNVLCGSDFVYVVRQTLFSASSDLFFNKICH
jgi:hypothetical protein